ncbi:hydroxysqualene dehydroxylase HpnE [Bacteroidota bacterium]
MTKCLIIGGGLSGLSAAVSLSKRNISVHLIEASPKLGGRAYSLYYPKQKEIIDNGQHIMMGCYNYTLDFLRTIGSLDKLNIQKNLDVRLVGRGGTHFRLSAPKISYPINLVTALLRFKAVTLNDRISVILFFIKLFFTNTAKLEDLSVKNWLEKNKQSTETNKCLWEILAIGTLNTTIEKASAAVFAKVLKEMFLKGNNASSIIIPDAGLSQVFCDGTEDFLKNRNCKISLSEKVEKFIVAGNRIVEVVTNKNSYSEFDYVITTIPHFALVKLNDFEGDFSNNIEFEYSPILNIHLWLRDNPFAEKFYGLIDSKIHWIFNHNAHLSLVTSSADDLINLNMEEILNIVCEELEVYFPDFERELVTDYKIIKEKRATFIPSAEVEVKRRNFSSKIDNLILAGDWTNTGLPSTIESAVKSGVIAASRIT